MFKFGERVIDKEGDQGYVLREQDGQVKVRGDVGTQEWSYRPDQLTSLNTIDTAAFEDAARALTSLRVTVEGLHEQMERISQPIEQAANRILQARRTYRRSGQYPSLTRMDSDGGFRSEITREGARFHVSNGIDHGDDFTRFLSWEELAADPDAVRAQTERKRQESERRAAQAQIAAGERRLRAAGGE